MGVLIEKAADADLFERAVNETMSIIQSAESIVLVKSNRSASHEYVASKIRQANDRPIIRGYCIRCEVRIDYDPSKPYCNNCYSIWAQYGNPDYLENVCHRCGEYEESTMDKPQCYTCYTEWQIELK